MRTQEVAEHVLAKIDEIVQSGDIADMAANLNEWSKRDYATAQLDTYIKILDSLAGYAAVEPKTVSSAGAVAGNSRGATAFR